MNPDLVLLWTNLVSDQAEVYSSYFHYMKDALVQPNTMHHSGAYLLAACLTNWLR